VRPTRLSALVALTAVAGAVAYVLTSSYYSDVPSPPVLGPVCLALLAAAEGYTAVTTAARLAGRGGTKPIHPLTVARVAVLAKSTSPVAALALGAYAGFLGYVAQINSPQASTDLRTASAGVGTAMLLVVAALAMERVCRVKRPPSEDR